TVQWTSQYPWIAEVDSAGNITAKSVGSTIITASVGDDVNTVSYTVTVTAPAEVDVVNLDVIYDYGFVERFPDYMARMGPQLAAMQRFYLDEYGLLVNYSNPSLFRSYVDECPTYSWSENHFCGECNCSSLCENSILHGDGAVTLKEFHHTNYRNIMLRIPFPDMTQTLRLAYIGRDVCYNGWGYCVKDTIYGSSYYDLGLAMVSRWDSIDQSCLTTIHEIGHLFGIGDHYGMDMGVENEKKMLSTEEKNAMSDGVYSGYCIYGEDRDKCLEMGIVLCDGCKRDMALYIEDFLTRRGG
ncbi:MAG: hypothetical protein IJV82_01615, partial [Oscillospiraceae bacterium]|nr:hypothetical protein [Oscillospiraceae bacterium]